MNIPEQPHAGAAEISRPSGKDEKKPRPVFRKKYGLFISTGYPVMFYGTAQRPEKKGCQPERVFRKYSE
ncbi:hypothetical protein DOJ32_25115 [Salmonella enterica subsp. enterica serovar Oranienburg]|nr:hypothetical protein [Salmonella enterica subsp. enterica serovar Oranienburg]EAA7484698.1 hypothetical protein [Salmonella enterica subsp. enterica serovar Irumu]EBJ8926756.1 hypothetical protein [Salmonella enterica]MKV95268.1 hypothetical protein [Salmonella enterica subsp. enterica serovar Fresno]EBN4548676.1 hypothetical protein [Salmonella enterica]